MDTILDQDEPVPPELRGPLEIHGNPEPMLEDERSRPGCHAARRSGEVDVEGVELAIHVDGPGAGVPDRVRNHDVRRDLQEDLVAVSDPE